jgi:hypothetical protein
MRKRWHLESLLVGPTLEAGEISLVAIHVPITLKGFILKEESSS